MVTSSSTLRACSTTTSASSGWWSNTSAVSRSTTLVITGRAWAPIAAMVATSPATPPAPRWSLALKLITQAGRGLLLQVSGRSAVGGFGGHGGGLSGRGEKGRTLRQGPGQTYSRI
jgi:hypothetical protein